jgi:hypothetical protein
VGRGAPGVAQPPEPLHSGSAEFGIERFREIADRTVGPHEVVLVLPDHQSFAHMREGSEQCLVEQLVT